MSGLKQFKFIPANLMEWSRWMRDQQIENDLGNPSADGYVLSSTTEGVRSWVSRTVNPLAPVTLQVPTAETTQLTNIAHTVNIQNKVKGKMVFNTTTNKPVYAVGSAAGSVWVDATGSTAHTPS